MMCTFMWHVVIKDFRKILILLIAYVVYLIFGAFVFQYFEAPLEQTMRLEVSNMIEMFDRKLKMLSHPNITKNDIKDMIHKFLVARDMNLVDRWGIPTNQNWNFYNSIFFSTTVVTTIGYGHLLPSTASGKIFCLFYALFGIPMTGILLGAIGNLFSRCFMNRIKKIRKKYHNDINAKIIFCYCEHAFLFFLPWFIVFLIIPSAIFVLVERWSFLEGFYYSFITLTTIGFGDYVAGNYDGAWVVLYKLMVVLWIIFGLSYLSMVLNFIGRGYQKVEHSEMMHSMAHSISEPFLQKHNHIHSHDNNPNKTLSIEVKEDTQRRHSDGGSTPTGSMDSNPFSFEVESHHHNHHKSISVIPYYT